MYYRSINMEYSIRRKTAVLLLALVASVVAQNDEFCFETANCCEGKADRTPLADWDDCTVYYRCFGGASYNYACTIAQFPYYNPVAKVCQQALPDGCIGGTRGPVGGTTPSTVIPTTTTPPIKENCTEEGAYYVPYPGDCKKYMVCSGATLLPDAFECPPGTLFDPEFMECNFENLVTCKPTCPETGVTNLPYDGDCNKYWECAMGVATSKPCPVDTIFDSILGVCNPKQEVFCPNLCSDAGIDFHPNSENCGLYWLCISGTPNLKPCLPGLHYDPLLQQCNIQTAVDCGTRPIPIPFSGTLLSNAKLLTKNFWKFLVNSTFNNK